MSDTFMAQNRDRDWDKELQDILGTKDTWSSKTAWDEQILPVTVKEKIKEIKNLFRENINSLNLNSPKETRQSGALILRKNKERTDTGNIDETAIEREFVKIWENTYNQFNLLSGIYPDSNMSTKAIDLVRTEFVGAQEQISELIELKQAEYLKNPLYAALQILYYYLIFDELEKLGWEAKLENGRLVPTKTIINLKVLIPEEYAYGYLDYELINAIKNAIYDETKMYFDFYTFQQKAIEYIINDKDGEDRDKYISDFLSRIKKIDKV